MLVAAWDVVASGVEVIVVRGIVVSTETTALLSLLAIVAGGAEMQLGQRR